MKTATRIRRKSTPEQRAGIARRAEALARIERDEYKAESYIYLSKKGS